MQRNVLILGLGNILLQDEGLGVRAVERLTATHTLPDEVQVIDAGTLGLNLLPYFVGITDLLIVDAVQSNQPPGSLIRLEDDAIPATLSIKMSMHQVGLPELLAVSRFQGTLPRHLVLWGMEPASLEPSLHLSPLIAARLGQLVQAMVTELRSWDVVVEHCV